MHWIGLAKLIGVEALPGLNQGPRNSIPVLGELHRKPT
ncbi:hypothetical protein QIT81_gp54 [Pseudomonas phage MR15]|uniref:Uncharacterized protein n=1 Tax=Pseudomonas phage MR15 TaxID=2711179 RepID=A0A6M3TE19_9CAUD|nr:hypothetical protein QIT81_gp54 [Pseudomonas phage MR15]QJD55115.1 hypothetical protein Psm1vBMR13_gp53c [Pseudomonas phage MR13]QJD55268.1 hypothetical protein Psm1vBMR15_gp54c [Pseudomonas phage MR15]